MVNCSVVVPTMNEESNIPNLLDNLVPQLESGDEVIIVDGGSDDMTVDISLEYGCDVYVAEDSGIGQARNIGSKKATREVVVSTDSDSIPPEGWLDRIKHHFETDEDLVVLWGNIEDRNGVPIRNLTGKFSTFFGGASGNNTAFRREYFDELEKGYPDIDFLEDVFIIGKLSSMGKSKRDNGLVMVMDMDRERYQTVPVLLMGMGLIGTGAVTGGRFGDVSIGSGLGMIGTEMAYEGLTDTPLHHDEFGVSLAGMGYSVGDRLGDATMGLGGGLVVHHILTEGLSMAPTELMRNTDIEEMVGD